MKTQALGPFLGINNRLPDFALHVPKVGDWLRSGVNVEVTNAGTIVRRKAESLVQSMTGAHSLHMVSATAGYLVRDSVLYAITLPTYSETLVKILASDARLSWVETMGGLYASNGTDIGRVSGSTWTAALPTPGKPASPTQIGGGLEPGQYQVAVSYVRLSGANLLEEGGVSESLAVTLSSQGGIRVNLPAATAGATHVNIYLTQANGEVPYLLGFVAAGTATFDCIALPTTGREAPVRFDSKGSKQIEAPLPAGELFSSMGRLCSIVDNSIYAGIPFRPGYYLPIEGVIRFTAPVTLAIENQNGTYICGDKTRWIPGDLISGQERIVEALPYGAVKGTAFKHPDKPLVGWFGENGIVLADPVGQVIALTEDALKVTAPVSGIATVLEGDYTRVVSCGWCVNLDNKAATSVSDWDFTSTSGEYGTKTDGIYRLNGTGNVAWSVGLGKQNFGTETFKHLPAVYAGMASESPLELTVSYVDDRGEAQEYTYASRDYGTELQMQRFDTGKGIRSNWFDLTLSNIDGSDFTLASVSFAATASTRRI